MKIGDVEIKAATRLAPMAGVTNAPFRLIARECGSGLTTTEEMDAAALLINHPHADAIAAYYPEERPLAMQLLGKDAEVLVRAAEKCQRLGADIVDLNMGCPMPKITGKGKGAALMRDVAATSLILRALRKAVSVPLTVKFRGGWDDEHLNAVEVAQMAEAEGVDAITVHPRTRSQRFTGKAPWAIIREHFGEKYALVQMKKHLAWYTEGLGHATECRARIFQTHGPTEVWDLFQSYWDRTIDRSASWAARLS